MTENGKDELLCQKGDVIVREGTYGNCMYKLLAGSAAVYAHYGEPGQKLLSEMYAGEYFGEMAVIEIRDRSATVVAAQDGTRVKVIDATDLSDYLDKNRGEIGAVARHLSHRLRATTNEYIEVCDTLRELGRLDTDGDRVSEGLLARVRKFARLHLSHGKAAESDPPASVRRIEDRGFCMQLATYHTGDVVFRERDHADCMYCIHMGRLGVFKDYDTPKQRKLTELTTDMFFGEMGLFEGLHRTATVVALEDDTEVEAIREQDLAALFEKNPGKVLMILQHLSGRLRQMTKDYLKACAALAEAEEQIKNADAVLTPEAMAQIEYMNQLLLSPEVVY